jgi:hypothetical protein
VYDTKSTFITLAMEDGADRDVIRDRVTHTSSRRDAFSGYDRGPHWVEACQEVAKLRIRLLATAVCPDTQVPDMTVDIGSGGGLRSLNPARSCNPEPHQLPENAQGERATCGIAYQIMGAWEQGRATTHDDDEDPIPRALTKEAL